jgi:hypothetical protein
MVYRYFAFGLHIQSTIQFPELPQITLNYPAEVTIRFGEVPKCLPHVKKTRHPFQVNLNEALLKFKNVGRFWIKNGKDIYIQPKRTTKTRDLRLYLLGSCMGCILKQRGFLNLHGSAVMMNGEAVLFLGKQKAGKSTLAAFMKSEGYALLSDDLCPVSGSSMSKLRTPNIQLDSFKFTPAYPQLKLWNNTLKLLGISNIGLRQIDSFRNKFALPVDNFENHPVPIRAVFLLRYSESLEINLMPPQFRIHTIMKNTYRPKIFHEMFGKKHHFHQCASLCAKVPVSVLTRPKDLYLLSETVQLLKQHLSELHC